MHLVDGHLFATLDVLSLLIGLEQAVVEHLLLVGEVVAVLRRGDAGDGCFAPLGRALVWREPRLILELDVVLGTWPVLLEPVIALAQ